MRKLLFGPFLRWLARLSHPRLFLVVGVLFAVDLVIPNLVPWDDLLLGLGTLLLARWKKHVEATPPPIGKQTTRTEPEP